MGYSEEIYKVSKANVEKVRNMTPDELLDYFKEHCKDCDSDLIDDLEDNDTYIWFPAVLNALDGTSVFDFGKYYENVDNIHKKGEPMFTNKETNELYSDYSPYIVGKEAILDMIEFYRQKILNYYSSLLLSEDDFKEYQEEHFLKSETNEERRMREIKQKVAMWKNKECPPYNLDDDYMINSWLYEYEIFELVFIYKTTDWEKDCFVFFGY